MAYPHGSKGVTHHALQSKQNLLCETGRESQVALPAQLPIPASLEPFPTLPRAPSKVSQKHLPPGIGCGRSLTACFYIYFVTLKHGYCSKEEIRWKVYSLALLCSSFCIFVSLLSFSQCTADLLLSPKSGLSEESSLHSQNAGMVSDFGTQEKHAPSMAWPQTLT